MFGDELRLLLPIALADGTLHPRERTLIERFAMARARAAGREPDAADIAAAVRWAQANVPSAVEAEKLAANLRANHTDALAALWDAAQSLSEADGVVTAVENVRLMRLKSLLQPAHSKGAPEDG
jgi:tellurite resistance protein